MPTLALLTALGAALIALLVGLFGMRLGTLLGLLDHPDGERKLHADVTPLVGGIGLVVPTILAGLLMLLFDAPGTDRAALIWFMVTSLGIFLIGIADDRIQLTAPTRLGSASALLLVAISQVPDFSVSFLLFAGQADLLLLPTLVGIGFTLLCFVGFLNAVNMADGKNGLVIGQALIWAGVLMVRLPEAMLPLVSAMAAALFVLFLFNLKGKLFLGDGGSYGLSAMFGLLAIYAWNQGFADMHADDVALIFALPVFDTIRLILHRSLQGKSPFTPGRDHLHHYLYTRWGWPTPLPWVLALVAIPNGLALLLPGTGLIWLGVTLAGYFVMLWAATTEVRARTA